jgi:hypothetical protein
MVIGYLGFDNRLTIAASVMFASWVYDSPSRLTRVPTKLDLMPALWGYPQSLGWVRTHLPYQMWQTSFALRHGLAPRPVLPIMSPAGPPWGGEVDAGTAPRHHLAGYDAG